MTPRAQYVGGANLYEYAAGGPLVHLDSRGEVVPAAVIAAIKGFVAAEAACVAGTGIYAAVKSTTYNDKYRHCYAACLVARICGALPSWAVGYVREMFDELEFLLGAAPQGFSWLDILANADGRKCAGWETHIPIVHWGSYLWRESCECCCKKKHKP